MNSHIQEILADFPVSPDAALVEIRNRILSIYRSVETDEKREEVISVGLKIIEKWSKRNNFPLIDFPQDAKDIQKFKGLKYLRVSVWRVYTMI